MEQFSASVFVRVSARVCVKKAVNSNFLTADVPFADKTVQIRRPCNTPFRSSARNQDSLSLSLSLFRFSFVVFFFQSERENRDRVLR